MQLHQQPCGSRQTHDHDPCFCCSYCVVNVYDNDHHDHHAATHHYRTADYRTAATDTELLSLALRCWFLAWIHALTRADAPT